MSLIPFAFRTPSLVDPFASTLASQPTGWDLWNRPGSEFERLWPTTLGNQFQQLNFDLVEHPDRFTFTAGLIHFFFSLFVSFVDLINRRCSWSEGRGY